MREFKFRAWDPTSKKMIIPKEFIQLDKLYIGYFDGSGYPKISEDFILMQYTGVNDKNKKEIYEGDIIEIRDLFETPQTIAVVEWNDYGYFGVTEKGRGMIDYLAGLKTNCVNFVVIGNIYENPELLEEG